MRLNTQILKSGKIEKIISARQTGADRATQEIEIYEFTRSTLEALAG